VRGQSFIILLLCLVVAASVGGARAGASAGPEEALFPAEEAFPGSCSPALRGILAAARPTDTISVWIYLEGRRVSDEALSRAKGLSLSARAAMRRGLRSRVPYDSRDLPVSADYLDALRPHCIRLRHASRYFNAVSAEIEAREAAGIRALGFVAKLDAVASGRRFPEPPAGARSSPGMPAGPRADSYGESYQQLNQAGLIELLEKGYNGSGSVSGRPPVLVGILDTGFRLDHVALQGVQVEARWDFIQGDSIVSDDVGDAPGQGSHGTQVLGVLAGRSSGELVGPAWGARYLLAKTEILNQEIPIEEDHWVAGIEWADSAGADVVTSSLGYIDWYTLDSLDGNTALCTRAADIAVSHGIVVVNSAGNRGLAGIVAPADGDSVIAVGAVDRDGEITTFSSRGPTADGRIKPDFAAMGLGVRSVSYFDTLEYSNYNGTSFAAPLVAGVCALLLEAHPDWDPIEVRGALRATSSMSGFPDNAYGYGIPNAALAAGYPESFEMPGAFPNPFSVETRLQLSTPPAERTTVRVYDCRGARVKTLAEGALSQSSWTLTWDGRDERGSRVASGVYFIVIASPSFEQTVKVIHIR